ncbi:MAG: superoxide dismutase family protein [Isosphaeraceae bacterium]|nr:superoxide dismutase family protein [Isosphaeraceae bacterium]
MPITKFVPTLTVGALLVATTSYWASAQAQDAEPHGGPTKAIAVLYPTKGSTVSGTVTFTKVEHGVRVHAHISGLTPGKHGFHIHEFGDSSSPDGKAAGGHFNPEKHQHGGRDAAKRHVGDLGNIEADANGEVDYDEVDKHLAFHGAHSILGRGLVVHEKADDLKTQPTGDAGGRVAVGVIGVAKGE